MVGEKLEIYISEMPGNEFKWSTMVGEYMQQKWDTNHHPFKAN